MKLWYDVSDIIHWHLCHVTGIQRTVIGILGGLVEAGVEVKLVSLDPQDRRFREVALDELPPLVREQLPGAGADRAQAAVQSASEDTPRRDSAWRRGRRRVGDALLSTGPEATALRLALRDCEVAVRKLRKGISPWLKRRLRGSARAAQSGAHGLSMDPSRSAAGGASCVEPFAAGDTLVSLGANWGGPLHASVVAGLRAHGVYVVRMIYDLIPTLKPQWLDDPESGVFHSRQPTEWFRRVLAESDVVLTISQFSASEIRRYCADTGIVPAPVSVVRLGDTIQGAVGQALPPPRFVPSRPFFLCVCTIDPRKNHRLLYDAWNVLVARDPANCPDLVCVGEPHLYVKDLLREIRTDPQVSGRVHFVRNCADVELEWYYRHCMATIYPSRYEGWGLPVAESLARGRMVLASNATSIPEISRDLPVFFDPLDTYQLVALVERVMREPEWVREREETVRAAFEPTRWTSTASQVMQAIGRQCA